MRQIIIILLLLGSTTLFSQIRLEGSIKYKIDQRDIPYRIAPASSSARGGEIWRPLKGYYYWNQGEKPHQELFFRYNTKGVLQQEKLKFYVNPLIAYYSIYNQTFTKEGFDFLDTITYYQILPGTDYIVDYRRYYDYHYYDRYPQDSFYYVEYWEDWNEITQEWKMWRKSYMGHFDTTLFVIRELYDANYVNGEWVKSSGYRVLREYDAEGVLTANIVQECNSQTGGEYVMHRKYEYLYDEDRHIETYVYLPDADDWKLRYKSTDIEYAEWYSNGQPGVEILMVNRPEYLGLADKRVKMKSYTRWALNDNDEWELSYRHKHDWDLNGTQSHIDSVSRFYDDAWQLYAIYGEFYDERGDFIQKLVEDFNPDGSLSWGSKNCFLTTYHPEYDECESYYYYGQTYQKATQSYDSVFGELTEYFDWWDVTKVSIAESEPSGTAALSIFPNPVSGMVIISAESEIEQLSIFDITGRMVVSQSPAGERVVFDAGALPPGVYLVRALLKDGGVRRGKVVVH